MFLTLKAYIFLFYGLPYAVAVLPSFLRVLSKITVGVMPFLKTKTIKINGINDFKKVSHVCIQFLTRRFQVLFSGRVASESNLAPPPSTRRQ